MKTLIKFMKESLNEAAWKSQNGTYGPKDADAMVKAWKITLLQAYKALDILDNTDNPPKHLKFEKDFKAISSTDTYIYNKFEEEWKIDR